MNQLRNQPMGVFSFPEEYQAPQALGLQINYNRQDIHMQHNYQVFLHFQKNLYERSSHFS